MKSIIVIPALNPPDTLLSYVQELKSAGAGPILIVNDGSSPDKADIFDRLSALPSCMVLTHSVNLGKGRALKDAFSYILNQETWKGCCVITADSDGQHLPCDILRLEARMQELSASRQDFLVLGCRNFHQEQVPFRSRFGNLLTCTLFRLLYGIRVSDTQTGLRGISYGLLSRFCGLSGERFEYEMNMLAYSALAKIPVESIEITTVYLDNNSESHFNPIVDSFKIYRILFGTFLKYGLSSLLSALIDLSVFAFAERLLPLAGSRILAATVIARVISSLFNYWFNRRLVFGDRGSARSSLPKYYALCAAVMLCSAGLVTLFSFLPVPPALIKIVVDSVLYLLNYQVQRRYIFKYA